MPKGFFAITLAFVLLSLLLITLANNVSIQSKVALAKQKALALEEASFVRFEIEENLASLIRELLKEGIKEEKDSFVLNAEICKKAEHMLKKFKQESYANIEFFITDGKQKESISMFCNYSKTIVLSAPEGKKAVYSFTGGKQKDKVLRGIIKVSDAMAVFEIRPGYAIEVFE